MNKPILLRPNEELKFNELHSCCWQCGPSGVRWCLKNGYDPNEEDERGWTALIWLTRMYSRHNKERKKIFRWLIAAGANIEHKTKSGDNILVMAKGVCSSTFYRFVSSEYERLTRRSSGTPQKRGAP